MVLVQVDNTAKWRTLGGKNSQVHELGSEHLAMDISEFGPGGWKKPHSNPNVLLGKNCVRDETITGDEFRLPVSGNPVISKGTDASSATKTEKVTKMVAFKKDCIFVVHK